MKKIPIVTESQQKYALAYERFLAEGIRDGVEFIAVLGQAGSYRKFMIIIGCRQDMREEVAEAEVRAKVIKFREETPTVREHLYDYKVIKGTASFRDTSES